MNLDTFIKEICGMDMGIVSFNTYTQDKKSNFYMMVAEKGTRGLFYKKEGRIEYMDFILVGLLKEIREDFVLRKK